MKAIEVKNLTKKYGNSTAVDGISFDVEEGALFAFLGENGAGKSTTINMLSTILSKTEGDVQILGHTLGKEDDIIRENIGIVFQNSVLDNDLTVDENIRTRAGYYGISRIKLFKKLKKLKNLLDYKEIKHKKYSNLSGGQRRRVDLIRALINEPKILFLDEPTTGLDSKARKDIWKYLNRLRKDLKLTIFLTTHYMEETTDADRLVIIDKGKIIANSTPKELKNIYTYPKLIWYTEENEKAENLLKDLKHKYNVDHYNIKFLGDITSFLYEHRDVIKDFEYVKGTMDDVFLNITGRKMK